MNLVSLMPILWAERILAQPILTALVPSARACRERGRRRRPGRDLVLVDDSNFPAFKSLRPLPRRMIGQVEISHLK